MFRNLLASDETARQPEREMSLEGEVGSADRAASQGDAVEHAGPAENATGCVGRGSSRAAHAPTQGTSSHGDEFRDSFARRIEALFDDMPVAHPSRPFQGARQVVPGASAVPSLQGAIAGPTEAAQDQPANEASAARDEAKVELSSTGHDEPVHETAQKKPPRADDTAPPDKTLAALLQMLDDAFRMRVKTSRAEPTSGEAARNLAQDSRRAESVFGASAGTAAGPAVMGTAAPPSARGDAKSATNARPTVAAPADKASAASGAATQPEKPGRPEAGSLSEPQADARRDEPTDAPRAPQVAVSGETAGERVAVVSAQTLPAPAAQMSPTSASLAGALGSDVQLASIIREATQIAAQSSEPRPLHTLRIQLNPIDLGAVTAQLTAAGDELSIELHVDTVEAQRRLSDDSEAIVKSLRSMGFEIERVTVQHTPQAQTQPQPERGGASGFDMNDGGSREAHDQNRGHGQERNQNERPDLARSALASQRAAGGGGVYI